MGKALQPPSERLGRRARVPCTRLVELDLLLQQLSLRLADGKLLQPRAAYSLPCNQGQLDRPFTRRDQQPRRVERQRSTVPAEAGANGKQELVSTPAIAGRISGRLYPSRYAGCDNAKSIAAHTAATCASLHCAGVARGLSG